MSSITHRSIRKTALPRTGRTLDAVPGGVVTSSGGSASSGGSSSGSVTDHSQLTGIICIDDKFSDSAKDIHLTAKAAKDLGRLLTLEIIKLEDKTEPSDNNLFSALRTLEEIRKKIEDNTVTLDARYLRKDIDDFAEGNLEFRKNIFVHGEAGLTNALIVEALYSDIHAADFDVAGFHLSAEGDAWLNNIYAKKDSYFAGNLSSPNFSSGFPAGYGWAITWRDVVNAVGVIAKKTHLEIDDATFRGVLRVYEMVISQLLGENGTHLTTDMMKIKSVDIANKIIYLDTEENVLYNPFWTDDVLMVQRFNGMPTPENDYYVTKQYEFAVEETHIGSVDEEGNRVDWIKYKNFVGDESLMEARDTLVRVDNLTNPDRKGIIKQTSVEPGSPYMDIIYAMKTDPENAIRARYGMLDGLITSYWGQLYGPGIMCDNAYLKGHFMLHTGEDVKTKFEIMEGLFRSEISSIKTQISTKDNYLSNASFATNTDKWSTVNEQNVFAVNGRILMFNNNLYANKKKIAAIVSDAGQRVLRIKNSVVRQANADLANKPSLDITGETVVIPTFYVSFKYRCLVPGLLKVGFAGKELYTEENVSVSNDYVLKEFSGKWDGTGDFIVECTGDIYVTMLALTTDALADFKLEMKTIIEQTDEHIKLLGEKIDKNAGTITNLGIELDNVNESLMLYATKATVNDLESRYQASMLELTPAKINATVSEQITRVSEAAKAAAIAVANKAQESANKGIADAKAASDRLTGWASDGVISPPEKLTLKQEAKDLASEKVEIIANAGKYGIATTGYVNAYNAYLGELNYHSTATPENIVIRATFATYQTAYYNARQSILDQIAAKTKQNAQDYADNIGKTISASLNIEKGRIDTLAGKFDANGKLIEGAGWITTTQGNTWYAGKSLENGQNIISYINQTPGNTVINSNRINLVGAVSFSMLSDYASVNNRINGKASMSDVTNALSNYVTNSGLNSKLSSYALASTLSDYVQSDTLANTLKNYATNAAANSAATTEFKKLADAIVNGNTTILGGFVSTKIIDTDSIYANQAYIGKYKIKDGWLVGETSGGANDTYALMKLRHTKSSDGSFSQITLGSNVNNSLFSNQRVTARIYNGISNKSSLADWGDYYRNTALQLEANYGDINIALETIGGRMHRGRLWEIEEITPITGGGTYNTQKNGSFFLFRDLKEDLTFELPTFSTIQDMFGNFQSGVSASQYGLYSIRILIDRYCSYRVLVAGTSTTPLLNHNGDIQNDVSGVSYGARWMSRGDFMVLVFYNKAWYIQSYSN